MPALDWEAILARHEIFGRLEPEARRALVHEHSGAERTYPAGEVILRQGETGDSIYLIGAGAAEVVLRRPDEKDLTLYTLGDGELFGEMALLERRPRSATVKAAKETTVLEIPGAEFEGLIGKHPGLALAVLAKLSQRLRYTDDRILDSRIWRLDETVEVLRSRLDAAVATANARLDAAQTMFDETNQRASEIIESSARARTRMTWVLSTIGVVLTLFAAVGYQDFKDIEREVNRTRHLIELDKEKIDGLLDAAQEAADDARNAARDAGDAAGEAGRAARGARKAQEAIRRLTQQAADDAARIGEIQADMNAVRRAADAAYFDIALMALDQGLREDSGPKPLSARYSSIVEILTRYNDQTMLERFLATMDDHLRQHSDMIQFLQMSLKMEAMSPSAKIITYYYLLLCSVARNDVEVYRQALEDVKAYIETLRLPVSLPIGLDEGQKAYAMHLIATPDDAAGLPSDQKKMLVDEIYTVLAAL